MKSYIAENYVTSNGNIYKRYKRFILPTQVAFFEEGHYYGGIGFYNYVICAHCGMTIDLDSFYEEEDEFEPLIVFENSWVDFSDVITNYGLTN